jgi:hypothetical protein
MNDLNDVQNLSSEEIDNLKVEKEKELQQANYHLGIVEEENHRIGKQILELRIKKKDSDIMLDKAKHNARRIAADIRILTSAFWASRNGGR